MNSLEVLNKIYDFTVKQLVSFLEEYDVDLNEFNKEVLDILDDGIQGSILYDVYSLAELAKAATVIASLDKLPYPRVYKKLLGEIDEYILTKEEFEEYYKANRQTAALILTAALETSKIIKTYRYFVENTIQEKPSTN